jgi:hypothetical protein
MDYVYWAVRRECLNKVQHDPDLQANVTLEKIVLFVSGVGSLGWTPPKFLTLSVLLLSLNVLMCGSRMWRHKTVAYQSEVCGWISSCRPWEFSVALITNGVTRRRFSWGTAVKAVRSRDQFPIRSFCYFSLTWSLGPHYGTGVDSPSNSSEYQGYFLNVCWPVHRADDLATFTCRFS